MSTSPRGRQLHRIPPHLQPPLRRLRRLISSGTSRKNRLSLTQAKTGDDVFFLTGASLVKADFDTALDIYDAHECSLSACIPEAAEPAAPCTSESSCKAPPTPQPEIFGAPASATFSGAGNITPTPPAGKAKPPTRAELLANRSAPAERSTSTRRSAELPAKARLVRATAQRPKRAQPRGRARVGGAGREGSRHRPQAQSAPARTDRRRGCAQCGLRLRFPGEVPLLLHGGGSRRTPAQASCRTNRAGSSSSASPTSAMKAQTAKRAR